MPLECLSQLCVKVLVERAAVSPTLAVIFLVALPFTCNKLVEAHSVCKSSCAFRFTCYPGVQETYGVFAELGGEKLLYKSILGDTDLRPSRTK